MSHEFPSETYWEFRIACKWCRLHHEIRLIRNPEKRCARLMPDAEGRCLARSRAATCTKNWSVPAHVDWILDGSRSGSEHIAKSAVHAGRLRWPIVAILSPILAQNL